MCVDTVGVRHEYTSHGLLVCVFYYCRTYCKAVRVVISGLERAGVGDR